MRKKRTKKLMEANLIKKYIKRKRKPFALSFDSVIQVQTTFTLSNLMDSY